jgi:hypothetical protein
MIRDEIPSSIIDWTWCSTSWIGVTDMPGIEPILLGLSETNTGNIR